MSQSEETGGMVDLEAYNGLDQVMCEVRSLRRGAGLTYIVSDETLRIWDNKLTDALNAMREYRQRLRTALARSPEPMPASGGWRPISEAPRDGRWIIAWFKERAESVRWSDEQWTWFDGDSPSERDQPTHWMPLPPAPGSQQEGKL